MSITVPKILAIAGMLSLLACGGTEVDSSRRESEEQEPPLTSRSVAEHVETQPNEDLPLVVFLGDSLTAGFGVAADEAFPAVIARRLEQEGRAIRFVNAGISGDTTAGALNRTDWVLSTEPDVVVVALGANDGLRGFDPSQTEENLKRILAKIEAVGARTLLVGIFVPTNYGPDYSTRFAAVFPRLAQEEGVSFLPFLLEGVAGVPELNLPDGVHPNPEGQRRVAEHVLVPLMEILPEES